MKKSKYPIDPKDVSAQARLFLIRPARKDNQTGYKGVVMRKPGMRFFAMVWQPYGDKKSIGGFSTPIEAAKAYDKYMRENVGSWVYTNFKSNGERRLEAMKRQS